MTRHRQWAKAALVLGLAALPLASQARIVRIEVTRTEPAFGGASFGAVGPYERVIGRAFGEVDPTAASNAVIQDIGLAPRNARGMVEYSTELDILRPADPKHGNGALLFNILNRGHKGAIGLFNADMPAAAAPIDRLETAGDGWMQRQGYTTIWFGWQADVLPDDVKRLVAEAEAKGVRTGP